MIVDDKEKQGVARQILGGRRILLQLALTAAFVGVLAWRVNIGDAIRTFSQVGYGWVVPGLVIFSLSKFIHSYRWQLTLEKTERAPVTELFGIYLVSNMTNSAVPLRLGDLLRVQIPAKRFGIPRAELTASVFVVETVLDGFTFLVLILAVVSFLDLPELSKGLLWGVCVGAAIGFVLALVVARFRPPDNLAEKRWLRLFSEDIRGHIARIVPQFLDGLEAMRDPRRMARAIAVSFPAWLVEAVMFWFFGLAFGLDLAPHKYIIIMITANLVVAVPITPWNIGTYEVALQEVISALGVDRSLAAGYAIGIHIFSIMWITFTGLISVWLLKLSLRDVLFMGRGAPAEVDSG
jgi:uncharacterized protein (TIRG00374 family)